MLQQQQSDVAVQTCADFLSCFVKNCGKSTMFALQNETAAVVAYLDLSWGLQSYSKVSACALLGHSHSGDTHRVKDMCNAQTAM